MLTPAIDSLWSDVGSGVSVLFVANRRAKTASFHFGGQPWRLWAAYPSLGGVLSLSLCCGISPLTYISSPASMKAAWAEKKQPVSLHSPGFAVIRIYAALSEPSTSFIMLLSWKGLWKPI